MQQSRASQGRKAPQATTRTTSSGFTQPVTPAPSATPAPPIRDAQAPAAPAESSKKRTFKEMTARDHEKVAAMKRQKEDEAFRELPSLEEEVLGFCRLSEAERAGKYKNSFKLFWNRKV
jgi:hypothetical protein